MKNMFMLVFQSMKLLVMSFVSVIIIEVNYLLHRKHPSYVRVADLTSGDLDMVVCKYGVNLGLQIDEKHSTAIRWFFNIMYDIDNIWNYLASKGVNFVSVQKTDVMMKAGFSMTGNRILYVDDYLYESECSVLVHEIQHALQFHKYRTLKLSHGFLNLMAKSMVHVFGNTDIYYSLPYEQDSYKVQNDYELYYDNMFVKLYNNKDSVEFYIQNKDIVTGIIDIKDYAN